MIYEFEGKTEKEAIENAAIELGLEKDQFDVEIMETQKGSLFKKGFVKIRVHTVDSADHVSPEFEGKVPNATVMASNPKITANPMPQDEFEEKLLKFVQELITKMGYVCTVDVMFREDKKIGLRLTSESSSILIGRKGKNLDAIQLLTNVYAAKLDEDYKIIVDSEDYRMRHEEYIVRNAFKSAEYVRKSGKSKLLEPMNPFERRLIHTALNDFNGVETKSEGEGLYKQVRIIPVKND